MNDIDLLTENHQQFDYMFLSRLISDCEYYLGSGSRNPKYLWAGNEIEHIKLMKDNYNNLAIKPEWISYEQVLKYEKELLTELTT